MNLRRLPLVRIALARPRLFVSILCGVTIAVVLPASLIHQGITRALIAWNAGAVLYLVFAFLMMAASNLDHIRLRARAQDEGAYTLLLIVTFASLATLCAIAAELSTAKDLQGWVKLGHIALAGLTVLTTWAVTQTMFALHYAHIYHQVDVKKLKGLDFPGDEEPDYFDFLYAASIIGTSGQTADVSFNTRTMRRIGLLQSVFAFFFNTILLALTINIAAGLV
jgi:uncharacterized membrane protein